MKVALFRCLWLVLIVAFHFIPGFSGVFLIEAAVATLIVGGAFCVLHSYGMIPGTEPYRLEQQVRRLEAEQQMARIQLVTTRIRAHENEHIDSIRALTSGEK